MKTVTFGNKNSYADFGLILDHKEIGKPEPRTNYIDVPARDGHLDLTEAFGEVKYKERKIVFYFSYIGSDAKWESTLSALHNYLNGQRHKIYFEANYYWVGRCFVGDAQTQRGIKTFTVECDCEPYKYRLEDTIVETKRKNLFNLSKIVRSNGTATGVISDNKLTVTGYLVLGVFNDLIINKTYTFSFVSTKTGDTGGGFSIEFRNENSETIKGYYYTSIPEKCPFTFTIPEGTKVTYFFFYGSNSSEVMTSATYSNIQLEEGANATAYEPYDTDIINIINDRKTVTPYVEILAGEPILSWEDKKTGIKYNGVAIQSNGKYLDLKLYEGKNTLTVKGGDIRLTYREASL